ncbi:MAG: hypothetical protein WB611_32975 [Stellaceae bacterium]
MTGSEDAWAKVYPDHTDQTYPREPWFSQGDAGAYGTALLLRARFACGRSDIDGDPIVVVLTERVSDAHLVGLRQDGVSYIFARERELFVQALEQPHRAVLGRPPAAAENLAVAARIHMADHIPY